MVRKRQSTSSFANRRGLRVEIRPLMGRLSETGRASPLDPSAPEGAPEEGTVRTSSLFDLATTTSFELDERKLHRTDVTTDPGGWEVTT